ncbi:hypothetical protein EG329_014167 [Mollisiaceae sp. DMI_Dod_QoI]|nr:hypothetical protein EG329_014167 [Helotiales sp. DMI_Dod_QoI]
MRLLRTERVQLEEFACDEVPHYAILSHTWEKQEVTLQDMKMPDVSVLQGYEKIRRACAVAAADGFEYIWIDTCCIDKTSSAELSEALNSMYRWYQEAEECYAYLADVSQHSVNSFAGTVEPDFQKSRWFTRGWTLQELIAPSTVIFLGTDWQELGTKSTLHHVISEITGIPSHFLLGDELRHASVAQRMSWASKRKTTRVEDLAYCLMGLFGIYMPMLYGEGKRAFIRLQEEIMKVSDDHSLFAWRSIEDHGGLLATSPSAFAESGNIIPTRSVYATSIPSTLSSRGVHLSLRYISGEQSGLGLGVLNCTEIGKESLLLAIHLRDIFLTREDFARERSFNLELYRLEDIDPLQHHTISLYVQQWHPKPITKWDDIERCAIKLEGIERLEVAQRIVNLNPKWELENGLMVTNMKSHPDSLLGRLMISCKDGTWFHISIERRGGRLSANIAPGSESNPGLRQVHVASEQEGNNQDRIVEVLGNGTHVNIAIKKRVFLLGGEKYLTGVMEISYSSTLPGMWLENITLLVGHEKKMLLWCAIESGHLPTVKFSIEKGAGIDSKGNDGRTPLSWAAENGHEDVIQSLLKNGAKVDLRGSDGRTPLSWAAENGHEVVAQSLLENGAKVDLKDNDGRTALSWSVQRCHVAVLQLLLLNGAEVNSKDMNSMTPLLWAAENGHESVVKFLSENGADLESKGRGGTPLWLAANGGHDAVVKLLLDTKKVDINSKGVLCGSTPLWKAVDMGYEGIVKLLIDTGEADIDARVNGQTPLWRSVAKGHVGMVKLLLMTGKADVDAKRNDQTPLWIAVVMGHEAIVELLLATGKVNANTKCNGQTLLDKAITKGNEKIVGMLLEVRRNSQAAARERQRRRL